VIDLGDREGSLLRVKGPPDPSRAAARISLVKEARFGSRGDVRWIRVCPGYTRARSLGEQAPPPAAVGGPVPCLSPHTHKGHSDVRHERLRDHLWSVRGQSQSKSKLPEQHTIEWNASQRRDRCDRSP